MLSVITSLELNTKLFIILYIGHKIGDYLFQTDKQAVNKTKEWGPLISHCFWYTLIVIGMAYLFADYFKWSAVIVIFISHMIIDHGLFLNFWAKKVKGITDPTTSNVKTAMFELDQSFHYFVIFLLSLY